MITKNTTSSNGKHCHQENGEYFQMHFDLIEALKRQKRLLDTISHLLIVLLFIHEIRLEVLTNLILEAKKMSNKTKLNGNFAPIL